MDYLYDQNHKALSQQFMIQTTKSILVICVILGLVLNVLGIILPHPTSADEQWVLIQTNELVKNIQQHWQNERSILFYFPRVWIASLISPIVDTPERAAFILSFLCRMLATLALVVTANQQYGKGGAWVCLVLCVFSIVFFNYTVKVLRIIDAAALFACALAVFSSRRIWLWGIGAVLVGVAFILHYHIGTVAISLAISLLISDVIRAPSIKVFLLHYATRRLLVALISLSIIIGYGVLVKTYAGQDYFSDLLTHGNLHDIPVANSSLYWVLILFRLDPFVWYLGLLGVICMLRFHLSKRTFRFLLRKNDAMFVDRRALFLAAIISMIVLTLAPSLSGMTRQIFLPMLIWFLILSGFFSFVLKAIFERRIKSLNIACITICFGSVISIVLLSLAASDAIRTRGVYLYSGPSGWIYREIIKYCELRNREEKQFQIEMVFNANISTIRDLSRRPDLVAFRPRYFPFPRFEEEPYKYFNIIRDLKKYKMSYMNVDDFIYTNSFYVNPPLKPEAIKRFVGSLPVELRRCITYL